MIPIRMTHRQWKRLMRSRPNPGAPTGEVKRKQRVDSSATPAWVSGCPKDEAKPSGWLHKAALWPCCTWPHPERCDFRGNSFACRSPKAGLKVATDQAAIPTVDVVHPRRALRRGNRTARYHRSLY